MKRSFHAWLLLLFAAGVAAYGAFACGDLEEYYKRGTGRLSRHSRGAAIDIAEDDSVIVAVNRDAGTVSVFPVSFGSAGAKLGDKVEIGQICNNERDGDRGEPWQVVIHPDGNRAFVVCRSAQVVAELVDLKTTPRFSGRRVSVGSEPTGIALTPRGTAAWVANWADGTVQRIDTAGMIAAEPLDLNAALVAAGYLGNVRPRPALAHPRSLAISNDGDDDEADETLVVTEYFSQQSLEPAEYDPDTARVGLIYKILLDASQPTKIKTIPLKANSDIGFKDVNGGKAGCFPNQLQSVTINGYPGTGLFAYVTSICASPKGPIGAFNPSPAISCQNDDECKVLGKFDGKCIQSKCHFLANVKTVATPAISVIDIEKDTLVENGTIALNRTFWEAYEIASTPEASPERKLPLLANDLAFLPGGFRALISAGGADAIFRLTFEPVYANNPVKEAGPIPPIDIGAAFNPTHKGPVGPIGIAMAHSHSSAFVANGGARTIAVVELTEKGGALNGTAPDSTLFPSAGTPADIAQGKRLFNFGLQKWSSNQQGWGACAECHIDGLTDNVTWFFPRGPRQTLSVDTFFQKKTADGEAGDQRNFGWNASLDEPSDLELSVIRSFFGGNGLILSKDSPVNEADRIDLTNHSGLNGSTLDQSISSSKVHDWELVIAYMKSIRTPRRPTHLDAASVERGRQIAANGNCAGCHGGSEWTISTRFYKPDGNGPDGGVTNGALKTRVWDAGGAYEFLPVAGLPDAQTMRYRGADAGKVDSLTCALRNVGTFRAAESGVEVRELRDNMTEKAQGEGATGADLYEPAGYNPPSLVGVAAGAPYFHAGNARTLEAAFDEPFLKHHASLAPGLSLKADQRADLALFLLTIDGRGIEPKPFDIPPVFGANGGVLCAPP